MKSKQLGFTLIEIMVVITIAAIMIGAAVMAFPDSTNDRLKEHGERFSALISLAQDESILQSQDFAVTMHDAGYSFSRRLDGNWTSYSDKPLVARRLDDDIKAEIELEGLPYKLIPQKESVPQIFVYSSGEMTPFSYKLTNSEKSQYLIKFDAAGNTEQMFIPHEDK